MLNEWFVKRRGLAYGIIFGATGISGLVLPFVIQFLLREYGFRTTLRVYSIAMALLSGPALPMLKSRFPYSHASSGRRRMDRRIFRQRKFYNFAVSNLLQGLGYFLPSIYLPSYATSLGLSSSRSALLLALMNLGQVLGQVALGYLSDRTTIYLPLTLSTLISSTAVYTLWGLSSTPNVHAFATLVAFALLYGYFAGGYSVLWARLGMAVSEEEGAAMGLYGVFSFERPLAHLSSPL
ncbi:MAG: hypothetical protein M1827_007425 [Pycnora praestabilis]|nr:MAG: hypothetical protein M1827_007425 [Pycnora praestabilis]